MVGILRTSAMGQVMMTRLRKKSKSIKKKRNSKRLRPKKKLKEPVTTQRKEPMPTILERELEQAIELSQFPIQHGNPYHKILFITRLGLVPRTNKSIVPFVKLHRLADKELSRYTRPALQIHQNTTHHQESVQFPAWEVDLTMDSEDDLDLDLELVVSPDIPGFFEEIPAIPRKKMDLPKKASTVYPIVTPPNIQPLKYLRNNVPPVNFSEEIITSDLVHPIKIEPTWETQNTLKASVHFIKHDRGCVVPGRSKLGIMPFVDLTVDEEKVNLDDLREKLLGFDTILEFAE